jgi:hypothetical protein
MRSWLLYESSEPANLRQLEVRVVAGGLALLQLILYLDEDRVIRETQVRIDAASDWLPVRGPGSLRGTGRVRIQDLAEPPTPDSRAVRQLDRTPQDLETA